MFAAASPLAIQHSTYDAGALYDSVLRVTVDGVPRCAATVVTPVRDNSTSLALSTASCFLQTATLSREQQADCIRGACGDDVIVPASSVRLVSGPDARTAPVVARVKRLAVRFTAWWAMPDVCSTPLCGEGWDVALLELEQGCELGPMPCVPPVGLPSVGATFGLTTLAIGYGEAPGFDRRAEWDLGLDDGSGVRRHVAVRCSCLRAAVWRLQRRPPASPTLAPAPPPGAGSRGGGAEPPAARARGPGRRRRARRRRGPQRQPQ